MIPVCGSYALVLLMLAAGCRRPASPDPEPAPPQTRRGPSLVGPSLEDRALLAGLDALRNESRAPLEIGVEHGTVRHASFDVVAPVTVGEDPDAVARWFLDQHSALLGVAAPAVAFELTRRSPDGLHVFFRQLHAQIPIFPAELVVHTQGAHVTGFDGGYLWDFVDDGRPALAPREAEAIAAAHLGAPSLRPLGETGLRYVDLGLAGDRGAKLHLAYLVPLRSAHVFVDARTGEVVHVESLLDHGLDLDIETANGDVSSSCWITTTSDDQWFDEDGLVSGAQPDAEGWQANTNARLIYQFFFDRFGRDSYCSESS